MTIEKRIKQVERALGDDKPPLRLRFIEQPGQPTPERDDDGVPLIWVTWEEAQVI